MKRDKNIYLPLRAKIKEALDIGNDVKLFKVIPPHPPFTQHFHRSAGFSKGGKGGFIDYLPGQFFMVGKWGSGEVPISIASTKGLHKHIELVIRRVGTVTTALNKLKAGDTLWLRGPYGNGFNTDSAKKRDVVFIAGGIGIVPLRSLINFILLYKKQPKKIFLLYGSKNPFEILFEEDIKVWDKKGVEVILTVDVEDKRWKGNVGLVTEHIGKIKVDFKKACAYVCGPEIMIKNTMKELSLKGMPNKQIATTLEARMKCGTGKCGQCYHGAEYICTNGSVYTYEEIKKRKVYGP